jgi:hypothetical protein
MYVLAKLVCQFGARLFAKASPVHLVWEKILEHLSLVVFVAAATLTIQRV